MELAGKFTFSQDSACGTAPFPLCPYFFRPQCHCWQTTRKWTEEKPWSEPYIPPNCDHNLCPINDFGPAIRKGCNIIPSLLIHNVWWQVVDTKGITFGWVVPSQSWVGFGPAAFLRREFLRHVLSFRQDVLSWINHARLRVWPVSFVCLCSDAGERKAKYEH